MPYPPALPPPPPELDNPVPLHSPDTWMPFLGSFAPAGYEPAAAPDPLAWSLTWPMAMEHTNYVTGPAGGPPVSGQYPAIGHAPLLPAREDETDTTAGQTERDQLDLDALAQLDQVQSGMVLQDHDRAQFVHTSKELSTAAVAAGAPPGNGSSPPFDLFALLRSPSPVYPFGLNANTGGVPFAFDGWGSGVSQAVVLPHKALAAAETAVPTSDSASTSQTLAVPPGMGGMRDRQPRNPGAKSLPATVGHAASFLASSDWAFTQAYLLSHCE